MWPTQNASPFRNLLLLQLAPVLLGAANHKTHPCGYRGLNTALGLSVVCRGGRWDATKMRKVTGHSLHSFLLGPEEQGDETGAPGDPTSHRVEVPEKTELAGGPSLGHGTNMLPGPGPSAHGLVSGGAAFYSVRYVRVCKHKQTPLLGLRWSGLACRPW